MKQVSQRIYRALLSLVLGLFVAIGATAQVQTVNGVVQDASGEPLIGASVVVKGATTGVSTDVDGNFSIKAQMGSLLTVSYLGYLTQDVKVTSNNLKVVLQENNQVLDEVVVLGYGAKQRKQDLSASVGVVANAEELAKRPVTSTEAMLQGAIPGVTITANGGDPTSTPSLVIRGQGSRNGDGVLWVVDGVPGAPIASLSDIESIVVLKDAASAAIYGAQSGAGGVVLVTTKQAKQGPATLQYEGQFGFRKATNLIEPLNASQQIEMAKRSYGNAGFDLPTGWDVAKNPWIATTRTNWMDEIFRTAYYQRHNVSLNGGTENMTNRLSFSYNNDEGTLINTYSKDLSIRYNGSFKLNKYVTVREDLTWKNWDSRSKGTDDGYTGPILSAIMMPASATVRNPLDGTWGGVTTEDPAYAAQYGSNYADIHGDVVNPVRLLMHENRYNKTTDLWNTTSLEIGNIVPGLRFISRFTYNVAQNNYRNFRPVIDEPGKPDNSNSLYVSNYRTDQWNTENTFTYDNTFGKHQVSGLLSTTANKWNSRGMSASGSGFTDESAILQYLTLAGSSQVTGDWYSNPDSNVSLVARAGYSYDDRYFLTASWRRDYAARLVKQSNHGDFPAVTGAWKISSEEWFNNKTTVNLLKLRGSWGRVGNLGSVPSCYKSGTMWQGYYGGTAWYGIENNAGGNKYFWGNMAGMGSTVNPNLTWETSEQWDLGLDAEFFNNRLNVSLDYFDKKTFNLIQEQTIDHPDYMGVGTMLINQGEIRNKGFEAVVGWTERVNRDWTYFANANFSYLNNKVTDIGVTNEKGEPGVWTGGGGFRSIIPYMYQTAQGQPLGSFYLIKTDGIFQSDAEAAAYVDKDGNRIQPNAKAGDLKFVDYNGDGRIDDKDRQYLGNSMPKTTFAFSLGATYRDLTISAQFQGVGGAQAAYVGKSILLNDTEGNFNRSSEILNAWSETNKNSNIPRLTKSDTNGNFTTPSDYYLEDASYLRMKNLTVNYNFTRLAQKWSYLKGRNSQLNLYFSADNLFTITKYSGVDPECGGWDAMKYPVSRVFSFGINLSY